MFAASYRYNDNTGFWCVSLRNVTDYEANQIRRHEVVDKSTGGWWFYNPYTQHVNINVSPGYLTCMDVQDCIDWLIEDVIGKHQQFKLSENLMDAMIEALVDIYRG